MNLTRAIRYVRRELELVSHNKDSLYLSSPAIISTANISDTGVIASLVVFSVSSSAPEMIVVSLPDSSPPFPACLPKRKKKMHQ